MVVPCSTCGRLPLHEQPEAAAQFLAAIRSADRGRLHRAESVLAAHEEHRLAIADWLGGMLHRPPLAHPTSDWAGVRALVEALWWDLHDITPDPLSPVIDGLGIVPQTHPRLAERHPWSDEGDHAR